jgi:hypothetical protein
MDCGAIAVGNKGGSAGLLDRRAARGDSGETEIAAGRSFSFASNGQALSRVEYAHSGQTTPQAEEDEIGLDQLWFALSRNQQVQFGSHFARMLLKAVQQILSTPCEQATRL